MGTTLGFCNTISQVHAVLINQCLMKQIDPLLLGAPWLPKSSTVPPHRAPDECQFGFRQVLTWK